ncbi:hypothetical protein LINPERPRIM_LOCUS20062, partial [Linum perenne]
MTMNQGQSGQIKIQNSLHESSGAMRVFLYGTKGRTCIPSQMSIIIVQTMSISAPNKLNYVNSN